MFLHLAQVLSGLQSIREIYEVINKTEKVGAYQRPLAINLPYPSLGPPKDLSPHPAKPLLGPHSHSSSLAMPVALLAKGHCSTLEL
ncbi:hypothetical protein HGM15179_011457 [Zosterops borbonicus]|uniref:Uncharacterized protein n=1 Tax=Zosterops borbonicus TaxID=364589 RepID=A0A8K1LJ24_9PASS|nr:hypothetical protein HGM15179_011457 [Zosterops borbonicus]